MKLTVNRIKVNRTWFLRAKIIHDFYFFVPSKVVLIIEVINKYVCYKNSKMNLRTLKN